MSEIKNKEQELNEKLTNADEILNKIIELNLNQDLQNIEWRKSLKDNFIEFLKACKPVFIYFLDDARETKITIERKNQILENMLDNDEYDAYIEKKEELSDINGSHLDNALTILEKDMSVVNSCFGLLDSLSCFLPNEIRLYSDKIYKLTSVIGEIEEISYMR